ncbi:MAG TPA: cbb3-type cytochrome c oxidase subunit II [Gemmatimonadaceae bacterium]|nr:cbb3-type cytochrome c oxidase subunit II [Gemmatimonadaceae bacterium]
MDASIYKKPVAFAVSATLVVLVGTVATMAYPMLRDDMHPKIEGMRPLGPLELAGRDVYQREGCTSCHTQTVRPLRSEVLRYGGHKAQEKGARYSIAGEYAFDHPFLWGSKRTGPDLAFEGWLRPAVWHAPHLIDPQHVVPGSNMPRYAFLAGRPIDGVEIQAHMRALRAIGVPYAPDEIENAPRALQGRTEMDGLVAYLASLGRSVDRGGAKVAVEAKLDRPNPMAGNPAAVERGRALFAEHCASCHGEDGRGIEGAIPSLVDDVFLGVKGDLPDGAYFAIVKGGSDAKAALARPGLADGGMEGFAGTIPDDGIWSIVAWIQSQKQSR